MKFLNAAASALAFLLVPSSGVANDRTAQCLDCHPSRTAPAGSGVPALAGQHPAYIVRQLERFQAADANDPFLRASTTMAHAEDRLPRSAWESAAKTLSAQDCVYTGNPTQTALPDNPCASCHGEHGVSDSPKTPNLAGQNLRYLYYQYQKLREPYIEGIGVNAGEKEPERLHPVMGPVSAKLRDNVVAVLSYYSKLPCR